MTSPKQSTHTSKIWSARALILAVFVANLSAAIPFIIQPERFAAGFEMSGIVGQVSVRGMGILFLMWNATFPPVILHPYRYRVLFSVMLAQQIIGLFGETLMWASLPAGHATLQATAMRFILFDGIGLALLISAFLLTRKIIKDEYARPDQQPAP